PVATGDARGAVVVRPPGGPGPSVHFLQHGVETARVTAFVADPQHLGALQAGRAVDRAQHHAVAAAHGVQAVARLSAARFRRVMPGRLGAVHVHFVVVDHAAYEHGAHGVLL